MMKYTASFILLLFTILAHSQNNTLEMVNKLIAGKKYESAMKILNEADAPNTNPELVIAKTDLVLNYFTKSIMHRLFGLKDLAPNEDLMELRQGQGSFTMFRFDADSILQNLIISHPDNYKLRKALGNYYHEIHLKYGQGWFLPDSVVVQKFRQCYQDAYEKGVYDHWSLYGIGYAYLLAGAYNESVEYLKKSTELKHDYPSSHYNLAYAYLYTNQHSKGIESARKAFELYQDPGYKVDAARMLGVMYREIKQNDKALEYYYKASSLHPDDYYSLKPILELEIQMKSDKYKSSTKKFFLLAPDNPTIYQDLLTIYAASNKNTELLAFLDQQKTAYQGNNKILGNIYFYTGAIHFEKKDNKNAKANFEKSRDLFKTIFPPGHDVFKAIDSYINDM